MNWTLSYDGASRLLRITATGKFSLEGCVGIKNDFLAADFWVSGINILYDYRATDFNDINLEQMRKLAAFHEQKSLAIGSGRMAFLMGSPRDFGFARQYEMITEGKVLSVVRVFQEEEQALEWIAS